MELNLFELATKKHFQFESPRGLLTVEDLWDAPLDTGVLNLNDIAKSINAKLKDAQEENFVPTLSMKANKEQSLEAQKLEVVKRIIAVKVAERDAKQKARADKEKRETLLAALAKAEGRELDSKSVDELRASLEALDKADDE